MFFHCKKKGTRTGGPAAAKLTLEPLEERSLPSICVQGSVSGPLGGLRADTAVVSHNGAAVNKMGVTGADVEQEVEIDPASLPPAVYDAVIKRFPKGTLVGASFLPAGDGGRYDVDVAKGRRLRELKVRTDGVILEDEVGPLQPSEDRQKPRNFSTSRST